MAQTATGSILDQARRAYQHEVEEQLKLAIQHETFMRGKRVEYLRFFLERIGPLEDRYRVDLEFGPEDVTSTDPIRVQALVGDDLIIRVDGQSASSLYIRCFVRVDGVLRSWKPSINTNPSSFLLELGARLQNPNMWDPMPDPNTEEEDA